jgi:ATP-dependent DNA ligase
LHRRVPRQLTPYFSSLTSIDALALDGDDLRGLPLSMRRASLAKLLARTPSGIFLSTFEQGEIGPDSFRHT